MMDYEVDAFVAEHTASFDAACLEASQEVLDQWDEKHWGFGNLLPYVNKVVDLESSDPEVSTAAHDYLATILESQRFYPGIAYAFSFVRLERHLNDSLANWHVSSPTISAIFKGDTTRLHPEALVCIPDISTDTFAEHQAISDTVDLEAQIAHAAYLMCLLKNPELNKVERFRAAAKLLSFHIPHFAVRSGQKRKIAQECYDQVLQTIQTFEGIPDETLGRFLKTMDYQPDSRKSRRAAKWFLKLSGLSQFDLLDVNKRMNAREEHMGENHVTIRSQLEVEAWFPGANKLLSKYYKVSRWAGRLLIVDRQLDTPDVSLLLNDDDLPYVSVRSLPEISDEDRDAILKSCDPVLINNKAFQAIMKYVKERHGQQPRRDGSNHDNGHISTVITQNLISAVANGQVFSVNNIAARALHDVKEDDNRHEKDMVQAEMEDLEQLYGLSFIEEVEEQTKDPTLEGREADDKQAERLKHASPEARKTKLYDREDNHATAWRKAIRSPKPGFEEREIDYWIISNEVYGPVFEMEPDTRAEWRQVQKIFKHNLKLFGQLTTVEFS